jgi:hypothetical protein
LILLIDEIDSFSKASAQQHKFFTDLLRAILDNTSNDDEVITIKSKDMKI